MHQNPTPKLLTKPDSENRERPRSELIEARLLAESEEAFYMHRLRVRYSQIILLIAMIVPLIFIGILVRNTFFGDFFLKGVVVPKVVFISSTFLCFVAIYGFLLSSMIKRQPAASNLGDFSGERGDTNKNFYSNKGDKPMGNYCVNKNAQTTGEHEVHEVACTSPHLPNPENRINLGWHADCHSAVLGAKQHYSDVDGCYYCCNACHKQ